MVYGIIRYYLTQIPELVIFSFNSLGILRAEFWTCMYILVIFRFQLFVLELNRRSLVPDLREVTVAGAYFLTKYLIDHPSYGNYP